MTTTFPSATIADWRTAGQTFTHRGERIFLRVRHRGGASPVLLLIHGFPTSSWDWSPLWESLAAHFTLVAPDLIGFGDSAKPLEYSYSIADQADLCEAAVKAAGIDANASMHILAHDYGDTVAQELLARAVSRTSFAGLRSVCFLNGGLFPETHRPRLIQRLLASPLGPWLAERTSRSSFGRSMRAIFGERTPPSEADLDSMWSLIQANAGVRVFPKLIHYMTERRIHRERWVGALQSAGATSIALRLIDGTDDPVSGRHMAQRYQELVPHADVVLLSGIGHYPQLEAPGAVLRAFLEFHHLTQ